MAATGTEKNTEGTMQFPIAPRVLLVEDEESFVGLITAVLDIPPPLYDHIKVVSRVGDAVDLLRKAEEVNRFDLIITDLTLPDSWREETVVKLRQAAPSTPIMVLTGADDVVLARKCLDAGAQEFVTKDSVLSREEMERIMRQAIREKELLRSESAAGKAMSWECCGGNDA